MKLKMKGTMRVTNRTIREEDRSAVDDDTISRNNYTTIVLRNLTSLLHYAEHKRPSYKQHNRLDQPTCLMSALKCHEIGWCKRDGGRLEVPICEAIFVLRGVTNCSFLACLLCALITHRKKRSTSSDSISFFTPVRFFISSQESRAL